MGFLKTLLYIHQLPQNIIGLLTTKVVGAKFDKGYESYVTYKFNFGVSLGDYIIFGGRPSLKDIQHEKGHQKQSRILGWLYLLVIGIPSLCGNIWDRIGHSNWTEEERYKWYYSQLWEHSADKLGNVIRW